MRRRWLEYAVLAAAIGIAAAVALYEEEEPEPSPPPPSRMFPEVRVVEEFTPIPPPKFPGPPKK